MSYPTYAEMKDSGVRWLGRVPQHWSVLRLKRLCRIVNGATPNSQSGEFWEGDIVWITPDDLGKLTNSEVKTSARKITQRGYESCGTQLVQVGSIVVSTRAPIGHLGIAAVELCVNQGCRCLILKNGQTSKFWYYLLNAGKDELNARGNGSTFRELSKTDLESVVVALPSPDEQRAIAAFLNRKTVEIDALIRLKERQIELLGKKRQALISHAVTRGLDSAAPLRPSGIAWIGDIPAHWEVTKVKYLATSLQTGPFGSQLHAHDYISDGVPVINPANIVAGKIVPDYSCTVDENTFDRLAHHSLQEGDVVMGRRGVMGRAGLVTNHEQGWLCGTGSLRMRFNLKNCYPPYLHLLLSLKGISNWLSLESVGSTMENLNTDILARIPLALPPFNEQKAIVKHLDGETLHTNGTMQAIHKQINKLHDYRQALISAAVTGKIDVRGQSVTESYGEEVFSNAN